MKTIIYTLALVGGTFLTACGGEPREGEIDPAEVVETSPDYEDGDQDGDGKVSFEEQSPYSEITTLTTNYAERADSLRLTRDSVVIDPKYTDNEYEAAFSTSTTNPRNQTEGGITPGNNQKKQ
ncbi:hypothetical protein CLV84_2875 [Neolewinella xylanilytica]|uniref:EF-hand domain-containing protein n=1 Tax=Neolewinella xylanilytica TaxID=1514080 RepID=A0A2S6I447_9BACT|nr:hypothetical protein [Neolewinella xylanilytica]PPK85962.1 hypothetical protein CLV84_2875 [Neolewinella xylanilytica]